MGIVFRSSLYHITVLGACTYDVVIPVHKSKSRQYIKLQLSAFMIAGLYWGFLSNAGHVRTACCGHDGTYKDLREALAVSLLAWHRPRKEKENIEIKQQPII